MTMPAEKLHQIDRVIAAAQERVEERTARGSYEPEIRTLIHAAEAMRKTITAEATDSPVDQLAQLFTDLCDVVERAWMHLPVTGDGGPSYTSAYAREAANRILELVGAYGPIETTADLNYDDQEDLDETLDEDLDETLDAIEAADRLTEVIEDLTGVDTGEHSATNDPWQNAARAGEAYAQASGGFEYGIRWVRSQEIHRKGMAHEQAVAFVDPAVWAGATRPVHEVFEIVRRPRGPWQVVP